MCTSSQVLVAHACNPCYSGGRDQEDHCSRAAQANSSQDPILKKHMTESAGGAAQHAGLISSPSATRKKMFILVKCYI
jgi:hypothetical protein